MFTLRSLSFAAVLLASLSITSSALADDAPAAEKTPAEPRWYGYQTLTLDGVALGVTAAGVAQKSTLPAVGLVTYVVGAPIVHVVHGHGIKALADLGLRVGAPIGGALAGAIIGVAVLPRSADAFDGLANMYYGFVVGGLLGIGSAVAVDAAFLAREDAPKKDKADDASRTSASVQWTPTVAPSPGGATAGVVGTF
jgi:hypothetical protein